MKKLFFTTIIALFLSSGSTFSQSYLPEGNTQLNVGVGLSEWGVPFYIGLDHSIARDFTLGGEFSYRSYNEKWNDNEYHHNVMGFSGNVNYHFNTILNIPQKFDFYAGANLGFYTWSSPDGYDGRHNNGLGLGAQVGGRVKLSNSIGLNLELGGGNAFAGGKLGLTFKL